MKEKVAKLKEEKEGCELINMAYRYSHFERGVVPIQVFILDMNEMSFTVCFILRNSVFRFGKR